MIARLLKAGADVNARREWDDLPLHMAAVRPVPVLLACGGQRGPKAKSYNYNGLHPSESPLHGTGVHGAEIPD